MQCEFKQLESGLWHCNRCGYTSKKAYDKPPKKPCKPGLGDKVEQGLSFFGITKKRVDSLLRRVGIKRGCGCKKRQNWLNKVAAKLGF